MMTTLIWDDEKKGVRWLAGYLLAVIPAFIIAYSFFIWPTLYGVKVDGDLLKDLSAASARGSGNDLLNRIYFPMLLVVTLVLIVFQGARPTAAIRHRGILLLGILIGVFFLSSIWSVQTSITIKRTLLQCFIIFSVVLACVTTSRPEKILHYIYVFFVGVLLVNVFVVLTVPAGPLGHEGIYPQKNSLGQCAGVASLFILLKVATGRGFERLFAILMLFVVFGLLVVSKSKTSIGLFFVVPVLGLIASYITFYFRIGVGVFMTVMMLSLLMIFWLGEAADLWTLGSIANAVFGDPTITSRTYIWEFSSEMINREPLFGYGFGAFWSTGVDGVAFREAPDFIKKLGQAHNGYIDIILQIGWLGFALFVVLMITAGNICGRAITSSFAFGWFAITFFIYIVLYNLLESTYFLGFEGMSVILIVNMILATRLTNQSHVARSQ
ncbi:MAG: O-antigen ligase family protein [Hyphomicrobiales bacterium]